MSSIESGKLLVVRSQNPSTQSHEVTMTLTLDGRPVASARATATTPEGAEAAARRTFVDALKKRWEIE